MITRRHLLASALAAAAGPRRSWAEAGSPACIGAAREPDGIYVLIGISAGGAEVFRIPLPGRGHAAAAHPSAPEAVAFARRPGSFALVIDCASGTVRRCIEAPAGRHFYGHGAFIENGDVLCTSENDIKTGEGRIGFWSRADGYRRIDDVTSGGIGPHEIRTMPGGSLVVANGGIRTHPDRGRDKLNLDTMRPNLAYVSAGGRVLERIELVPELHRNAIRHLAVGPGGLVAFAMQWQGDASAAPPLLGLHRRRHAPHLVSADLAEQVAMQGYAGSVAFDTTGETAAITSPRGGRLHLFSAEGAFLAACHRPDICGLATAADGFIASDGLGTIMRVKGKELALLARSDRAWDNHLVAMS